MAIQETGDKLERWLSKIDMSGLPGRFKAWIYQEVVIPKILWLLTIYEFTSYKVEQLEKRINSRFRRWLSLSKCLSSAALYGNSNMVQLPFKSLVEEYKVAKVRTTIQLSSSKIPKLPEWASKSIHKKMEGDRGIKNCWGKITRKRNFWRSSYWLHRPGGFPLC